MGKSLSPKISSAALRALWAGSAVTALITVLALVDPLSTHLLGTHVAAGYPTYTDAEIDRAVAIYVTILVIVGILGTAGWVTTIRLARAGRRSAVWTGAALCTAGALIAVTGLTVTDTSGMVGLAPTFGWLLLAPCAIGVAALVLMRWQPGRATHHPGVTR
jgi:hypothetical protein